jgi:hypothetical protein
MLTHQAADSEDPKYEGDVPAAGAAEWNDQESEAEEEGEDEVLDDEGNDIKDRFILDFMNKVVKTEVHNALDNGSGGVRGMCCKPEAARAEKDHFPQVQVADWEAAQRLEGLRNSKHWR